MSFILDALRKSEHERQRNRAPGISDMRATTRPAKRSVWLPLAALLAGINIALLALLWFMGDRGTAAVPQAPAAPVAAPTPAPAAVAAGNRELAAEMVMELEPVDDPSRFASITPPSGNPSPASTTADPAPPATGGGTARLPSITQAMLDGRLPVTAMRMDLHVYSDNPQERFVFINTTRYVEGDLTSDGMTVRRISPEGAVLSYQGQEYLLTSD